MRNKDSDIYDLLFEDFIRHCKSKSPEFVDLWSRADKKVKDNFRKIFDLKLREVTESGIEELVKDNYV